MGAYCTPTVRNSPGSWVLLTDTPVAQREPTLYACRNWIEQGFRGPKKVG